MILSNSRKAKPLPKGAGRHSPGVVAQLLGEGLATWVSPFEEFFGYELLDHNEALGLPNGLLD